MSEPTKTAERLPVDTAENGLPQNGQPQQLDRRLYFQLHVFDHCHDVDAVKNAFWGSNLEGAIYLNVNNPYSIGILVAGEDWSVMTDAIRHLFLESVFLNLKYQSAFTLFGRTYASGHEPDLEDWLLKKPRRNALNPHCSWAVWYPLRRKPEFETLPRQEQSQVLMEHSAFGRAYAEKGLAFDVRLSCHGLDTNDNDFLIGLVSPQLHVLSKLVQHMRKTQQTSKYIASLGPFFVGKVLYQSQPAIPVG